MADDPFVCPKCGAKSYNPNDKREGYCGRRHEYTGCPHERLVYGHCIDCGQEVG